MITLAIASGKGGTAKTTTVRTLASVLAAKGLRVLAVDFDPQASLSAMFGIRNASPNVADVIGGAKPGSASLSSILRSHSPILAVAPSGRELAASELGLVSRMGREQALKRVLASVADRFDVALIDTPPGLTLALTNALVAAQGVIVPIQPLQTDIDALAGFMQTITEIREINPALQMLGVLLTFYDDRLNHHRESVEFIREAGLPLFDARIGRSVRVADAVANGQSITEADADHPQSLNYTAFAKEVKKWLDQNE